MFPTAPGVLRRARLNVEVVVAKFEELPGRVRRPAARAPPPTLC
jgi:hypothetical protein